MAERPADPTAPVFASGEPAMTSARDETATAGARVETHGTFWQRIEEATSQPPRGDGFDAWETRFQRPRTRDEPVVTPVGSQSSSDAAAGDDTALATWPGGERGQSTAGDVEWSSTGPIQRPGWVDAADAAGPEGGNPVAPESSDDRVIDHAAAAPVATGDIGVGDASVGTGLAGTMPNGPATGEAAPADPGDAPTIAPDRPVAGGSLLAGLHALATSLTAAANGDQPDFDRQVGELREILERARSRPRDIDMMMQLSDRLDTITELAASHERMSGALREAARQLGGPVR